MKQQWTIATTVFHTITGDKDLMEAKKAEILESIKNGVSNAIETGSDYDDGQIIANVTLVEDHVADPEVNCTTDIED